MNEFGGVWRCPPPSSIEGPSKGPQKALGSLVLGESLVEFNQNPRRQGLEQHCYTPDPREYEKMVGGFRDWSGSIRSWVFGMYGGLVVLWPCLPRCA